MPYVHAKPDRPSSAALYNTATIVQRGQLKITMRAGNGRYTPGSYHGCGNESGASPVMDSHRVGKPCLQWQLGGFPTAPRPAKEIPPGRSLGTDTHALRSCRKYVLNVQRSKGLKENKRPTAMAVSPTLVTMKACATYPFFASVYQKPSSAVAAKATPSHPGTVDQVVAMTRSASSTRKD